MKRIVCFLIAAVMLVSMCACGKKEKEIVEQPPEVKNDTPNKPAQTLPEASPSPEIPAEPEPEPEPEYTGPRNPLTGLPVDEDISNARPYA